jgi:hypothetical protein
MIIDEKTIMQPPPPYMSSSAGPPPFNQRRTPITLSTLPPHLLLQIVYSAFPQTSLLDEGRPERQRKTLYWLAISLRLVNSALYMACMHVLRSTYLPAYTSLVRPPHSSDPFPLQVPSSSSSSAPTLQRETAILDLFIALKVREDVWADDSELHLERGESFKDLFDLRQPQARLEDLVRIYGLREGVVTLSSRPGSRSGSTSSLARPSPTLHPTPPTTPTSFFASLSFKSKSKAREEPSHAPAPHKITPVPFAQISVSFSSRRVRLVLAGGTTKRTVVETSRAREEKLEAAAKRVVKELRAWLEEGG